MTDARRNELLSRAVRPDSVRVVGKYTDPHTYGVYKVEYAGRRFRFGNHPVREEELIREYGDVTLVALFREREDAEELAKVLND